MIVGEQIITDSNGNRKDYKMIQTEGANQMPDIEKVMKGIDCEEYNRCPECPYVKFGKCKVLLMRDVKELLKAQEPREPREPHYTLLKYFVGTEVTVRHPECPRCIENGLTLWDAEIVKGQAFCGRCGQAVKWE